jgi:tetratricopeptide (TPR) repeat protein
MRGISLQEANELFALRCPAITLSADEISEAHRITEGHVFWLDLLALQVARVSGVTLEGLLEDLHRGRGDRPDVLTSIWGTLGKAEQTLLRFMAEAVRPESEGTIEKFVSSELNYNRFRRALRGLIHLNLVVVKPQKNSPDLYDLHPLVRQFVREKFEPHERNGFIKVVLIQYDAIIGAIEAFLGFSMPKTMLERWTEKAELEISAGLFDEAFDTMYKVEEAMLGGGHIEEYIRVSKILLQSIEWETAPTKYKRFDKLVGLTIHALDNLGRYDDADDLIERLAVTIPQKTARYIRFCDIRAYSSWLRGDFRNAIEWASTGVSLKDETNVDTESDCGHTLALAQRDGGDPQTAVHFFAKGRTVQEIADPDEQELGSDGPTYGNVGRCLQFLGDWDNALGCYRKSIRLLESTSSSDRSGNRAYARQWIGEVYEEKGENELALTFFQDAINVLGQSSPVRSRQLTERVLDLTKNGATPITEDQASRAVKRWMA